MALSIQRHLLYAIGNLIIQRYDTYVLIIIIIIIIIIVIILIIITFIIKIPENERIVRYLDVGMGFGGLTVALAELYPNELVLGMEIRAKVCEYVRLRIEALRNEHPGKYQNAACLRTNCMRYLPNFFQKGQLHKIFFCFPDPHFKAKNHRRRIISTVLLSEYAHFLIPDGRLYTITDVEELYKWHVEKCDNHPYYERIPDDEVLANDPAVNLIITETEEGKKVQRMGGKKYFAVYRRRHPSEIPAPHILELFKK